MAILPLMPNNWLRWLLVTGVAAVFAATFVVTGFVNVVPASSTQRFTDAVAGRAVYDPSVAIDAQDEAALESQIAAIKARSGAELAIYVQVDPSATQDSNLAAARALLDQWGVGRPGFDDGLVILVSLQADRIHGQVSLYGGSGFRRGYLSEGDMKAVIDQVIVPAAQQGQLGAGLVLAVDAVSAAITPAATSRLELLRVVNSGLGLLGAPLALLLAAGSAFWAWHREGADPRILDSPSILMAGPPDRMTPALATVIRDGRATQHTLNTMLMDLAAAGRLRFRNLDRARETRAGQAADPASDPAIEVLHTPSKTRLGVVERDAWKSLRTLAHGKPLLTRESLWGVNAALAPLREQLEDQAVELGWFTRPPSTLIARWSWIGLAEVVAGGIAVIIGLALPMSGALLLGGALGIGGLATVGFGQAMSQRSKEGAWVDAMLKAYRRTLAATLATARSVDEVIAEPTVRVLADTPDKAVVWGYALGLRDEVAKVITRGLQEPQASGPRPYYPVWLGASSGLTAGSGVSGSGTLAGGSLFSGSAVPDIGGMFSVLGSIGSSPSSGSGGGFSGGSSGGGGGASGSF
ncbi:MAG TPA: TPM domain-containing protein [Candidatus Saccharimonadales bacterium]|nr:TPM domain-containing protein [Candidatus Saccharimonadales bacterium]